MRKGNFIFYQCEIMGLWFIVLIYCFLFRGVHSADQMTWLPCRFMDENVTLTTEGHINTKHIPRKAVLQFGLKGDAPVNPDTVTFLITPSKLDLRRYLEGVDMNLLSCELERYSTDGSHVRWPVKGEHEYNRWFTLAITHSKGLLETVSFIRQSTDQPPTGQHDYRSWTIIKDKEMLTTSVVMVLKTQAPVVRASLRSQPKLHCHFDIDHKAAKVTVEWHKVGDSTTLFSYNGQSGSSQGSGVDLKQLAAGDATYTFPKTKVGSEGIFVCSVHVHPLLGKLTLNLQIEEPPVVSLNVGPTLTLSRGALKKVVCAADGYYPLDVDIQWSHQGSTDVGPRVDTAQLSSHSHNPDRTLSLSAFFYLQAELWDSGRKFTCSVSHRTLSAPIRKTFTLVVTEPGQWIFIFNVFTLLVVMVLMMRYLLRGRRYRLC